MRQLPSRLRRLDDALHALPFDDAMLLSDLDGFLTGLLVSPQLVLPGEWLPMIWGGDMREAPFEDAADMEWFTGAVIARHNEIARDLARDKFQPIYDVDDRNGDVLWELWIDGFAQAMALRPESWSAIAEEDDDEAADALTYLSLLIAIDRNESPLDSVEINTVNEDALAGIHESVRLLHRRRLRQAGPVEPQPARTAKPGRNDPCPCGSGNKFKRCCG